MAVAAASIAGCYLSHERGDAPEECIAPGCGERVELDLEVEGRLVPGRYRARLVEISDVFASDELYVSLAIGEIDGRPGGVSFVQVRGVGGGITHEIPYRGPIDISLREDAIIVNRIVCEDCSDPLRLLFAVVQGAPLEELDAPFGGVRVEPGEIVCAMTGPTGEHSTRRALRVTDLSSGRSQEVDRGPPTDFGDPPLRFQVRASGSSCLSPAVPPPGGFETMTWIAWSLAP